MNSVDVQTTVGALTFCFGVMGAGKSRRLVELEREIRGTDASYLVIVCIPETAPAVHSQSSVKTVRSRAGTSTPALQLGVDLSLDDLSDRVADAHNSHNYTHVTVLVDEAQFLTSAEVDALAALVDRDRLDNSVVCFGLRTDFLGRAFEGVHSCLD